MVEDPAEKERWLTVAIVGAGPTGVELAGQVRELAVRSLRGEFRTFDPASVRVVLLDGGKQPLATFGEELSAKAAKELERLGVELWMGARVVGVDAFGVDIVDADGATPAPGGPHHGVGCGGRSVPAGDRAGQGVRRRTGPGRAHRRVT